MSLKKIAEMTGVSVSTVSRVLNSVSGGSYSENVRERVWAAAREIGYTPNRAAVNLRRGETASPERSIAVVTARIHSLDADPFFKELFMCVQAELFKAGCAAFRVDAAGETVPEIPKCDGMVILGRCSRSVLEGLKAISPNLVGIWRNPTDFNTDEVVCDGKKAAVMAVEYLLSLGHRTIGYIGDCSYESRYVGYCDALIRNSIPINYPLVIPTGQTEAEGYSAMEKIAALGEATAVFCANDITAAGALRALNDMGRKKPKIAVISIDNTALAQSTKPMLTTINVPLQDMAHMAVSVLTDRIERGHTEHLRVEFPCRLVKRMSCFEP